jgi:hypothetical protein
MHFGRIFPNFTVFSKFCKMRQIRLHPNFLFSSNFQTLTGTQDWTAHTTRTDWARSVLKLSRKEKSLATAGLSGAENRWREKPAAKMKWASRSGARTEKISAEKKWERKHQQIWDEWYRKKDGTTKLKTCSRKREKSTTRKAPGRNQVRSRATSYPAKLKKRRKNDHHTQNVKNQFFIKIKWNIYN